MPAGRSGRTSDARPRSIWTPDDFARISWPPGVDAKPGASLGERVFLQRCQVCHGPDGHGNGPAAPSLSPRPRDFTQAQFKYKSSAADTPSTEEDLLRTVRDGLRASALPEELWLRITTGLAPGAMPSYAEGLTPDQRWDIVGHLLSIARPAPWEPGGKLAGPGQDEDLARRGDYLAHFEMCGLCHTQIDATGIYRENGYFLAGGMRVGAWPHANFIFRNLTSDEATGLGSRSAEEIAGFLETLAGKLASPLPAAMPPFLSYADGDFADGAELRVSAHAAEGEQNHPAAAAAFARRLRHLHLLPAGAVHVGLPPMRAKAPH